MKKQKRATTSKEDIQQAVELRKLGQSLPDIARETGLSLATVGRHLKGIPAGTPMAHPPAELHSPYDTNPAPSEGDSDPFSIVRSHSPLLEAHAAIGKKARAQLGAIDETVQLIWTEIEGASWINEDMVEKAIKATIRTQDSEGEVIQEPPTDDEMLRRRITYIDQINRVQRNRIGSIYDLLKASQLAIKIEREAAGLDYVQELAVSLARVMAAGYTVEG
jgi:hypothetical protein